MTHFFINRPAFTIVLCLLISLIGVMGYSHLPVRWLPSVTYPVITIYANYPGANAALIEKQITTPIEMAISGVDGVDTMRSQSKQGQATLNIAFKFGADINSASNDVRSSIERIRRNMPKNVEVTVTKSDTDDASLSILQFAFFDDHRSLREVSDYVKQLIAPQFENIDGVGNINIYGDQSSIMRVALDPQKMAVLSVVPDDVSLALEDQNQDFPTGQIKGKDRYYPLVMHSVLESVDDFNNLIVLHHKNKTVRLKDIGWAGIEPRNDEAFYRVNGQPAVGVAIAAKSGANPLIVGEQALKIFKVVSKTLPSGMKAKVIYNQAKYIHSSISNVYKAIVEATICVLFVILVFFGSMRAAIIPIITIPVCLISSFAILYFCRFTINTISLMAMVLAIGLVVDDAIVMLENIMRHIELKKPVHTAAIEGGGEIVFSIIAMTITLAAVYAPIAFSGGMIGKLFSEFTYTLAGTVMVSGFIALTLSPMMCSRLLAERQDPSQYQSSFDKFISTCQLYYQDYLRLILQHTKWIFLFLVFFAWLIYLIFLCMSTQLTPVEDTGRIQVLISAPRDSSVQYTNFYMKQLEEFYRQVPEIESYDSSAWRTGAYQTIHLLSRDKRHRSAQEISKWLTASADTIPGIRAVISPEASSLYSLSGSFSSNQQSVSMAIMTNQDYRQLYNSMQNLLVASRKNLLFSHVDNRLKWDGEQFDIHIDREKAADMQVPIASITSTLSTLIAGRQVGYFNYGGNRYEILVQLSKNLLSNPNITQQLYVRNDEGKMLPLSSITTWHESTAPESLSHYNRLRSDSLSTTLASGTSISAAIKALDSIAKTTLPADVKYEFTSDAKNYLEANHQMAKMLILALLFIYLVLVAQFESFIDPLVVLFTVPFAAGGALLTLKLAGGSINIYSCIGLVTLIGLIAKHGILITDFANRQRLAGKSIAEAAIAGATLRLRPILMTTAAMVLGAFPLAFATGPGAESRQQIGWIIVGGLLFGTFFSLIVVPVMYTLLGKFK